MKALTVAAAAALLSLSACGGEGDDTFGDNAAEAADARAGELEQIAENASGAQEESLEAQAEAIREGGKAKEEAIDEADVNADAMSDVKKNAIVNGQ